MTAQSTPKRYPLGPYGLSIVLLVLFLVAWVAQTAAGWMDFKAEQQEHHQIAQWFGESGYVWHWLSQTMENWQSEFLQLLTFVILTAHLVHVGSHESKDNDDKTEEQLHRMEDKLEKIEKLLGEEGKSPQKSG